jgi:wyosine [tRNA(Phe)-imidazoG37] synthetase (radical SAM superfamily)
MGDAPTRHVYGPVPSRRLGRSLGVDLVPYKVCSYDCTYCQLGRTTSKTASLAEYVPVAEVLDDLAERLRRGPVPDVIGLAGSGEPTLHSRIGELIEGIKRVTRVPVAVLTNGSLLWRPEVREGLAEADVVLPSLDAGDPDVFARVNRPHPDVSFERMVEGLVDFAGGYRGEIRLEVFVLGGITDTTEAIGRIARIAARVRPARVQLNTVSRPPAEDEAFAVPLAALERLRGAFAGRAEVIAEEPRVVPGDPGVGRDAGAEILALVSRRPCTVEGIASGLGLHPNEVVKRVERLCGEGLVRTDRRENGVFYERVRGGGEGGRGAPSPGGRDGP